MNTIVFQGVSMSCLMRLTNIKLSLLRVRHLSDVPVLALLRVRLSRRHAPFLLAFHIAVSSNAVRMRYAECVLRVGIEPTFYSKVHNY